MSNYIAYVFINACISAFIYLFISKIGLREYIIIHATKLISQAFDCSFCLSFWLNMLVMLGGLVWGYNYSLFCCIFMPIMATPITRKLI